MKRILLYFVVAGILIFGLIQLFPFGHDHTNPPTVSEPNWPNPQARALVKEHCFQCHSNETEWPWYSNIAPASWLVQFDVKRGRAEFNFSDWKNHPGELDDIIGAINEGEMPPVQYWLFHPGSHLNGQQKQELATVMRNSLQ